MRVIYGFLWLVAILLACAVFMGFAGALHPIFDTLSLLRMPLAALCLLLLVFPMSRRLRFILFAAALAGGISTVPLLLPGPDGADLRLYSKNIWYRNPNLSALEADIRGSGADVVTLQEVSRANTALLSALSDIYPHQHLCRFSGWSGIAVLSRNPISATRCSQRRGLAAARITKAGRAVWVASVHLTWPWPYGNAGAAQTAFDELVGMEDAPVVMAGDFNIFPWAASVRRMARGGETRLAQPLRPTFDMEGVPLFLDHVHAPGGGRVSYRPLLGSDHLGILADLVVWP